MLGLVESCRNKLCGGSRTDLATSCSIGAALIDTVDDLINEGAIEPQLAMKVVSHFDRIIADVLADRVKARLNFKVSNINTMRIVRECKVCLLACPAT